jgi:hypothetical protein
MSSHFISTVVSIVLNFMQWTETPLPSKNIMAECRQCWVRHMYRPLDNTLPDWQIRHKYCKKNTERTWKWGAGESPAGTADWIGDMKCLFSMRLVWKYSQNKARPTTQLAEHKFNINLKDYTAFPANLWEGNSSTTTSGTTFISVSRFGKVQTMVYNTRDFSVYVLCPSSVSSLCQSVFVWLPSILRIHSNYVSVPLPFAMQEISVDLVRKRTIPTKRPKLVLIFADRGVSRSMRGGSLWL